MEDVMHDETFDESAQAIQAEIIEQARKRFSPQVIQHFMQPHNPWPMENADGHACITGPCGDTMQFWLKVEGDRLQRVHFTTDGCASSIAAGSMAASLAEHLEIARVRTVTQEKILECLGGLPEAEQHCALLASNTLQAALRDYLGNRTTEDWKKLYR
jgi:nitrogen fixation NifU-like protein